MFPEIFILIRNYFLNIHFLKNFENYRIWKVASSEEYQELFQENQLYKTLLSSNLKGRESRIYTYIHSYIATSINLNTGNHI